MYRVFANQISFLWNLALVYAHNFYYTHLLYNTPTTMIEENVVLFHNLHTTSTHTIIDFTSGDRCNIRSIIIENPQEPEWNILSVYDKDHSRDLTTQFKRFAHHYNTETKSFDFLESIKRFLNTSNNIVLIDDKLDEHTLGKTN
jgi:hypothetical protein